MTDLEFERAKAMIFSHLSGCKTPEDKMTSIRQMIHSYSVRLMAARAVKEQLEEQEK